MLRHAGRRDGALDGNHNDRGETKNDGGEEKAKKPERAPPVTFAEFLQGVPPSSWRDITDLFSNVTDRGVATFNLPELRLYCPTEGTCERESVYRHSENANIYAHTTVENVFINYKCSNCQKHSKRFALQALNSDHIRTRQNMKLGRCYKYGESPPYGFTPPARLQRLFQSDRTLFMKGRQCEIHALGIGAFVYYRRVVENHKNDIIDAVIKVAETLGAPASTITILEDAKSEKQFSKAMEAIKDAIPQVLYLKGANPITLLHSALSVGLHAQTDESCLAYAHDVRVVLVELSERLGQVLKDDAGLSDAVKRLIELRGS